MNVDYAFSSLHLEYLTVDVASEWRLGGAKHAELWVSIGWNFKWSSTVHTWCNTGAASVNQSQSGLSHFHPQCRCTCESSFITQLSGRKICQLTGSCSPGSSWNKIRMSCRFLYFIPHSLPCLLTFSFICALMHFEVWSARPFPWHTNAFCIIVLCICTLWYNNGWIKYLGMSRLPWEAPTLVLAVGPESTGL